MPPARAHQRLRLVATLVGFAAALVLAQLVHIQIFGHAKYTELGAAQRLRLVTPPEVPRGEIFDRNGDLLAGNTVRAAIEASPAYILDAPDAAEKLAPLLNQPVEELSRTLSGEQMWVQLAWGVDREVGEAVDALDIPGVNVLPLWRRAYPEGPLASHVLGFVNPFGVSYYGLEEYYDAMLRSEVITREEQVDPYSQVVPFYAQSTLALHRSTSIRVTIDRTFQALAQSELERALREYGAESGTIIILDPRNGEILAMVSLPQFDPGHYELWYEVPGTLPFEDPAISLQYEPGSVFKIVTMAAALDAGLVTPSTTYYDGGSIEVGGRVIHNSDNRAHGEQTMVGLLAHSLNVGAAHLSTQMGPEVFYRYVLGFGVGQRTGVDLAHEVTGQVRTPDSLDWHDADLGSNSYGQGLAVTPLQMAMAIGAVANGGTMMRPHVVMQRILPDGTVRTFHPVVQNQVIAPETAHTLTEMMAEAAEIGQSEGRVPGYRIAGKSGTASIPVPGGYDPQGTIASYAGFGPLPDPRFVILVKLDRPTTSVWGGQTAAPVFARLAARLFVLMGIPPDAERLASH